MVAHRESTALAKRLIAETCSRQAIEQEQLTLHADRGSSMTSKGVEQLLADLGVTKTHSRPYVSNDNPYSEAQFKTLKYCPDFPASFSSLQEARAFCSEFFSWYNNEHGHSGIALLTPASVHHGEAATIVIQRNQMLQAAPSSRIPSALSIELQVLRPYQQPLGLIPQHLQQRRALTPRRSTRSINTNFLVTGVSKLLTYTGFWK